MDKLFQKLNRIPLACIILAIIAVMYVIWGGYQSKKYRRESAVFDSAVAIEDADALTAAQLQAYDGKTVCLIGTLTVQDPPADPLTGLSAPGALLLERSTEMYQYSTTGASVLKGFYDYQQPHVTGKGGELYENPVYPSDIGSVTMLASVRVGPVTLGDSFVRTFGTYYDYIALAEYVALTPTAAFDNTYGLTPRDDCYTNGDPDDPQIGDIRVSFRYVDVKQYAGKMAFFGTLKNGVLEGGETDGNAFMLQNCDSVARARETVTGTSSDNALMLYFFAAFHVIGAMIIFAFVLIRRKKEDA